MNARPAQPLAAANRGPIATGSETPAPVPVAAGEALRFPASLRGAVDRAGREASAPAEWKITRAEFHAALERSVTKRFPGAQPGAEADAKKIKSYLESLHTRDLALALACSNGSAAAWDVFMAEFRPEIYRAARAISGAGGDAAARELADSLYSDLYGLRESGGRRKSLFEYFHGRSKLITWLHAVLAQRHVDEIRRARGTEPLENEAGQPRDDVLAEAEMPRDGRVSANGADPERASYLAALQAALVAALGALDPRDRLRLAYYYGDDRTLGEIGRVLGEHEATVSRKLDRTRRDVGSQVQEWLRSHKKWGDAQVRACLECVAGEWPFDLMAQLKPAKATNVDRTPDAVGSKAAVRKI